MKTLGIPAPVYEPAPNAVLQDVLASDDGLPEWLQLTPRRGQFEGRDGRRFNIKSPRALVNEFNASGEDIQLDVDHRSEFTLDSSAVGWITEMQTRNGGQIWARVEWTGLGESLVRSRTFRGLSPTFLVTRESVEAFHNDPKSNAMDVIGFTSIALTNRPNLRLKSLNIEQPDAVPQQENPPMDETLLEALGLNSDASVADAVAAINALKAQPAPQAEAAVTVDLASYVPRADFDMLNTKFSALRDEMKTRDAQAHQSAVDAAITEALKSGKISPASEKYHRASCTDAAGLARFQEYVADEAPIVSGNAVVSDKETVSVTDRDKEIAAQHGLTVEELQAARARLREADEID